MSYKQELINIYASNDLANVGKDSSYIDLITKHGDLRAFHYFREKIERCKRWIEDMVFIQSSEKNQVTQSLILVNKVLLEKDEEMLECCIELIGKVCTNKFGWSNDQKQYFSEISLRLKNTKFDYFLSFTQRDRSKEKALKKVNMDYKLFITEVMEMEESNFRLEGFERNLLAKTINHLLTLNGLKGFYFPEREEDMQKVMPKLQAALDSHFIFVQIIQNVLFDEPDSDKNICFFEYLDVTKKGFTDKQVMFVNAEGSRNNLSVSEEVPLFYTDWHSEALEEDSIILEFPENSRGVKLLKDKIRDDLSSLIKDYKKNLIEDVPWD